MFQRLRQYDLLAANRRWYRPRAYGDRQPDGTWDGWLVFFPLDRGPAIATERETMQSTLEALVYWAAALDLVYLEGALARALTLNEQPTALGQLAPAEYDALEDATRDRRDRSS